VVESSKSHSKGGRVRKHTTRKVRAQRHTQKEVWLENTIPMRSRALRRTLKEAGLENALPMRRGLEGTLKKEVR